MDGSISKQEIQDIENLFKNIDGPLFKRQRLAILNLIDGDICAEAAEALEGIQTLLDQVADIAYDSFGIDCLFLHESCCRDEVAMELWNRGDI